MRPITWTILVVCLSQPLYVSGETKGCENITLNEEMLFVVTAYIEGPRGTLKFPAIIDTGATHSFIPRSIADGIGYEKQGNVFFKTASGKKKFKVITAKNLSFLGASFDDLQVAVTEKNEPENNLFSQHRMQNILTSPNEAPKPTNQTKEELAVIGMSELSRTKFAYNKNILTVCNVE